MARLLVVDDLAPNRLVIKRLCEHFGHQVEEAVDGVQAVKIALAWSPELILLDISMPNMDGYEAARRIKEASEDAYLPIIFVTADTTDSSFSMAISAGGDDLVTKPVSASILESKISAHLRIRELNQLLVGQNRELALHNQRLRQEAELINHFFDKALQRNFRDPERISLHSSPASAFSGDLILIERGPAAQIYLLVGDFTGHGLQAAMGTLPVQQAFFELCKHGLELSELVRKINEYLYQSLPESMFFAATLLVFDADYRQLQGWFGGMPAAFLLDDQGELLLEMKSLHMPLGILDDAEFDSTTVDHLLPAGGRLYLFSDGAAEREYALGEMLGEEGVRELLQQLPPNQRFGRLKEDLTPEGSDHQRDDISLVEVICG